MNDVLVLVGMGIAAMAISTVVIVLRKAFIRIWQAAMMEELDTAYRNSTEAWYDQSIVPLDKLRKDGKDG